MTTQQPNRCPWPSDELMLQYHDEVWGVPEHDDLALFEFLALEAAQAGLSWRTILHKRNAFYDAFEGFDPARVAAYGEADVERMMGDAGIARNRLKIQAIIHNAQRYLEVQRSTAASTPTCGASSAERPFHAQTCLRTTWSQTPESDALSKDLKQLGFKFVGSTIVYAYMQSVGLVNDHVTGCFRAPR